MLKGIPKLISPELLKVLCEMGHGNEIAIVDANYPAEDMGQRVIRYPGIGVCELLEEIMKLFPLDHIPETPAYVLGLEPKDIENGMPTPPIWAEMEKIINKYNETPVEVGELSRQGFYDRSKKAYAIVQTGEEALYADLLLVKGVIK